MKLSAPLYHLKRKAKLLSRAENIPLNEALDRIARLGRRCGIEPIPGHHGVALDRLRPAVTTMAFIPHSASRG